MRVSLSDAEKSIDQIWGWYERARDGLLNELQRERDEITELNDDVRSGRSVFFSLTSTEVRAFFRELEFLAILDLLSATEAAVQKDFWLRVHRRRKDRLSREFRKLHKQMGRMVSMRRSVLPAWSALTNGGETAISDFLRTLKLRDWLAHGRYWTPKLAQPAYLPQDVFDVCAGVLQACALR